MEALKCEMCGANINITDNPYITCDYCGTIMTPSLNGATPSSMRLIKNGYTFLRLEDYSAAHKAFKRATKEYPEVYHGWWGLIISETKGFSIISDDVPSLNIWFKNIQKLASSDELKPLEVKYLAYARKIANDYADEEISALDRGYWKIKIRDQTQKYNKMISACEAYLAQGKDKIVDMYFARRFRSIGVNQDIDDTTELLRKAIIDEELYWHDIDDDHDLNAVCPFCDLRFILSEYDIERRNAHCPLCNSYMELLLGDKKHSKGKKEYFDYDDDDTYIIKCPECGKKNKFERYEIDFDMATCTRCGEYLEFDSDDFD